VKTKLGALVILLVVGTLGVAGFIVYERATEKDRRIEEQKRVIAALEMRLDRSWAEELVAATTVRHGRATMRTISTTEIQAGHESAQRLTPGSRSARRC